MCNVTKKQIFEYLDKLRESGITNMFGAAPYVANTFNMTAKEAQDATVEWMENFKE